MLLFLVQNMEPFQFVSLTIHFLKTTSNMSSLAQKSTSRKIHFKYLSN